VDEDAEAVERRVNAASCEVEGRWAAARPAACIRKTDKILNRRWVRTGERATNGRVRHKPD